MAAETFGSRAVCSWGDTLHSVLHNLVDHLTVTGRSEQHVTGTQYQTILDNTFLWFDVVAVPQVGEGDPGGGVTYWETSEASQVPALVYVYTRVTELGSLQLAAAR
jgi:hypothetical protein